MLFTTHQQIFSKSLLNQNDFLSLRLTHCFDLLLSPPERAYIFFGLSGLIGNYLNSLLEINLNINANRLQLGTEILCYTTILLLSTLNQELINYSRGSTNNDIFVLFSTHQQILS